MRKQMDWGDAPATTAFERSCYSSYEDCYGSYSTGAVQTTSLWYIFVVANLRRITELNNVEASNYSTRWGPTNSGLVISHECTSEYSLPLHQRPGYGLFSLL